MRKWLVVLTMTSVLTLSACSKIDEVVSGFTGGSTEPEVESQVELEVESQVEPEVESQVESEVEATQAAQGFEENQSGFGEVEVEEIKTRIVLTDERIGQNIAQIPYIEYDGDKNSEIDALNRSIDQGIRQRFEGIKNNSEQKNWIEIYSFPYSSPEYLQVVTVYCEYPVYGTDGSVFSINYDMKFGRSITVKDAMNELGMSVTDIEAEVVRLLQSSEPGLEIIGLSVTGFLIDGTSIKLFLEVEVINDAEETWKYIYSYLPEKDELFHITEDLSFEFTSSGDVSGTSVAADTPEAPVTLVFSEDYILRVNYFSNTYIESYDDGEMLGDFEVEQSDSFSITAFDYINQMEIQKSDMIEITSEIVEFLLVPEGSNKPTFEVFFYDKDQTVFFKSSELYIATPDEDLYFSLKELIGELRLGWVLE